MRGAPTPLPHVAPDIRHPRRSLHESQNCRQKHCPDNGASRDCTGPHLTPPNHNIHRPRRTHGNARESPGLTATSHLHAHPLLIARHHHPRSFPVLLIRRHLLTLRGHAEVWPPIWWGSA